MPILLTGRQVTSFIAIAVVFGIIVSIALYLPRMGSVTKSEIISGHLSESPFKIRIGLVDASHRISIDCASNSTVIVGITTSNELARWVESGRQLELLDKRAGNICGFDYYVSSTGDYAIVVGKMQGEKAAVSFKVSYQVIKYPYADPFLWSQLLTIALSFVSTAFALWLRVFTRSSKLGGKD